MGRRRRALRTHLLLSSAAIHGLALRVRARGRPADPERHRATYRRDVPRVRLCRRGQRQYEAGTRPHPRRVVERGVCSC